MIKYWSLMSNSFILLLVFYRFCIIRKMDKKYTCRKSFGNRFWLLLNSSPQFFVKYHKKLMGIILSIDWRRTKLKLLIKAIILWRIVQRAVKIIVHIHLVYMNVVFIKRPKIWFFLLAKVSNHFIFFVYIILYSLIFLGFYVLFRTEYWHPKIFFPNLYLSVDFTYIAQ